MAEQVFSVQSEQSSQSVRDGTDRVESEGGDQEELLNRPSTYTIRPKFEKK